MEIIGFLCVHNQKEKQSGTWDVWILMFQWTYRFTREAWKTCNEQHNLTNKKPTL